MNLQVEPPEKMKKKTTKSSSLPRSSSTPSFSLLPDEITVNCLARISRSYYPTLSIVSKTFKSILSSTELSAERSHIGSTEQCLYVCLCDPSYQIPEWFTLWDNPNRTLPNSSVTKKKKKKKTTIPQSLVSIPPSNFPAQPSNNSIVAVGSEIYVMGGVYGTASSAMRVLDCRRHTWRDAPSMNVARENSLSCVYDGKIYVLGGYKGIENGMRRKIEDDASWAEVFDTKTQTWERLPGPGSEIRKCNMNTIVEMEGKIMFGNSYKIYAYDTKQGKWESCENGSLTFPRSQCVIENVSYRYGSYGECLCQWYDIKDGDWKEVKGLDSLRNKYRRNGGSSDIIRKLVSFGGKLLLIWEVYNKRDPNGMNTIWCAVIVLEKHDGGEVWGNVEWVDVVHTSPRSWYLFHCLAVSI